jgi:hypothetical protein
LSLGVLSVAPSQAAHIGDSLTLTPVTSSIAIGETASATVNSSFTGVLAGDSITVTAIQFTPNAASGTLKFAVVDSYTSTVSVATAATAGTASVYTGVTDPGKVANTNYTLTFGAPTIAGTYVIQVYASAATTGNANNNGVIRSSILSWTVTVAAAATATQAYTQLGLGANTVAAALGAVDSVVAGSKTASTTIVGKLAVSLLNASAVSAPESYTATITGAGTLGQGGLTSATTVGVVIGRSITMATTNAVHIFADGTGGVGTVTISNAAGAVLATKTVSFYGDASVIVLSSNSNAVVGILAAPVKATVYDAAGYPVANVVVRATSADATVISNSYTASSATSSLGEANISLTGVKLGSAKITVGIATSATDVTTTGYAVKSDALTVTVGGSTSEQAGVVVTTDKQVYTPGSYAYVTVKAVDKAGKTLSPLPSTAGTYTVFATGGISASLPIETVTGIISAVDFIPAVKAGTADTVNTIVALAGEYTYKIKLPSYSGDVTFSWTTAAASNFPGNIAAGAVVGSVTVTLSDPGSQAAVDAATEATDAANAATDAALAAADAADAATAAAEDASAAVATLAKSVNTALGNLKKQITALTALVNKLLKK